MDVPGTRRKKLLQNLEVLVSKRPLTMRGGGLDLSRLESDGTYSELSSKSYYLKKMYITTNGLLLVNYKN